MSNISWEGSLDMTVAMFQLLSQQVVNYMGEVLPLRGGPPPDAGSTFDDSFQHRHRQQNGQMALLVTFGNNHDNDGREIYTPSNR